MKIIWICNTLIQEIALKIGEPLKKPESWITGFFNNIDKSSIEMLYLYPSNNYVDYAFGNVRFLSFKKKDLSKFSTANQNYFVNVFKAFKPDVIHIYGSEMPHTYEALCAAKEVNLLEHTTIHIQGLVSFCARHYFCHLPNNVINSITFRSILKFDNIFLQAKKFEKRGRFELKSLQMASSVLGRTEWDQACIKAINPEINYYHCNENLRDLFYNKQWNFKDCEKHSIFVSQSNYPLKGFHIMIEAFSHIVKKYPDSILYTTGKSPFSNSIIDKLKMGPYSKYLAKLIKQYDLVNRVVFLGYLNEEEMCNRFLKSNVFVMCSSIENSPNSLGEAMMLGIPCVASHVGGVGSMMKDKVEGLLYPADEPYMLSYYIDQIFSDENLAISLSENSKIKAHSTHNKINNLNVLMNIYKELSMK